MCLIRESDLLIADKDIDVWKVIHLSNQPMYDYNKGFIYKPNSTYRMRNLFCIEKFTLENFNSGFHSYSSENYARHNCYQWKEKVVKMTIPKGTSYVTGNSRRPFDGSRYGLENLIFEYASESIKTGDLTSL